MPKVYVDGQELILRLDPAIPPGREGTVYPDPSDPGFVIKLLHSPDDEWRQKLRVMLADPLKAPDVAWPTEAAYASDRSTVVGCRLPLAAKTHPIPAVYTTNPTTRWLQADYEFRVQVALNLAIAVDRVHQHGCVVGDLSPTNILVRKDSSLCLIDVDSFQVTRNGRTYRCRVGTAEYTPPNLHRVTFSDVDRTVYDDAFGLAVFVFQLLVGPGTHPFAARHLGPGTPLSLVDRIGRGIWPEWHCPLISLDLWRRGPETE
jgi:DNA-binding helix-hairpin-helix protein with protein kinase domain